MSLNQRPFLMTLKAPMTTRISVVVIYTIQAIPVSRSLYLDSFLKNLDGSLSVRYYTTVMGIHFFACLFLTRIYRSFSRYFHTFINGQIIQVDIITTYVAALSPVDLSHLFVIFICTSFYFLLRVLSRRGNFPSGFIYFSGSDLQQRVLIFFAYNNNVLQRLDEP